MIESGKKIDLPKKKTYGKRLEKIKVSDALKRIISHPNICSKEWVWEQYDHTIMGNTIQKPGGDSGVIRLHNGNKALAMTIDSSAEYCASHPLTGGKQIVCESWRNLISVGSKPLAITNCLNFGNPEKEKNMGEFVESINGIADACKYLNYPVVSGNVSFYNGTNDKNIKPTPTIGGIGLINDINNMISMNLKCENNILLMLGKTLGHLSQSIFSKEILGVKEGPPPEVNLFNEKNNGETLLKLIKKKLVLSAHDVSVGGMLTTLCEMCLAGSIGAKINFPKIQINLNEYFFGEDQSRYIIEIRNENLEKTIKILNKNSVFFEKIGITQRENLTLKGEFDINIKELRKLNNSWFKKYIN